jgi:mono/diheme cytochrome c family protein
MLGRAVVLGLVIGASDPVVAEEALSPRQALGQRILLTSCGLCHTKPDLVNPHMAPPLSRATLAGDQAAMVQFIKQGTETMPGFRYTYSDAQLAAVADYLSTVAPNPDDIKKDEKK